MYNDLSDEEILKLLNKEDIEILEILLERYNKYIISMVKSYEKDNIDRDELVQEATIGLYKAIKSYDENKNAKFKTYFSKCITNQLNSYLRTKQRKKNIILEEAMSLNNVLSEDNDVELLSNILDKDNNPLSKIIEEESNIEFKCSVKKILSNFEYNVFKEYIRGYDYIKISEKLQTSSKSVDNAIQRIKNKISNILNN